MTQSIEAPPVSSGQAERVLQQEIEVPDYTEDWTIIREGVTYYVTLDVKDAGILDATLRVNPEEDYRDLRIDGFQANPGAKKGAGKAMISAAIAEGRKFRADTLSGHFTNQRSLGALGRVVGANNLLFRKRFTGERADITFDQAMQKPDDYYTSANISHIAVPPTAN